MMNTIFIRQETAILGSMNPPANESRGWFTTTPWSVVLAARDADTVQAREALEKLCEQYQRPVYMFVCCQGYAVHDAEDLTQEFLGRFVEKEWLAHLKDPRAKFRSFLLTLLKHFLSDMRDRRCALKRGGDCTFVPLDEPGMADLLASPNNAAPDELFDRQWAETVVCEAARKLADEYARSGKQALYDAIKDIVPGKHGDQSYAEIGALLGISEQAVKNAVHAYRRRNRELVRAEVAQTVSAPREIDDELRYLIQLFSR
jgi:DNA-directed RNA polymerase specialized sigma24 family protein